MKRIILLFLIMMLCMVTQAHGIAKDSVLQRVDELKALVDNKFWPTFNAPQWIINFGVELFVNGEIIKMKLTAARTPCNSYCYKEFLFLLVGWFVG